MDNQTILNEKIGKILKEKRIENNYSLEGLQFLLKEKSGIDLDISNISRYESGRVKNMNPIYIKEICKIIGLNYLEMFKKLKFIDADCEVTLKNKYEDLILGSDSFFNNKNISLEDKKKLIDTLTEKFYMIKNNIKIKKEQK